MWLIKRVYMDGAGHEEAFYKDLTLDYIGLSQAVGSPVVEGLRSPVRNAKVVTSTYQQLVNGGGKSTYIALLLSIFEPSVSDFTQYLANHRQSEYHYRNYFYKELSVVLVEMVNESGQTLLLGHAHQRNGDDVDRTLFICDAPDSLMGAPFDEVPSYSRAERNSELRPYANSLRSFDSWLSLKASSEGGMHWRKTTRQNEWRAFLLEQQINVDLIKTMVTFNSEEGGLTRFIEYKTEHDFLGAFFACTMSKDAAERLRELVAHEVERQGELEGIRRNESFLKDVLANWLAFFEPAKQLESIQAQQQLLDDGFREAMRDLAAFVGDAQVEQTQLEDSLEQFQRSIDLTVTHLTAHLEGAIKLLKRAMSVKIPEDCPVLPGRPIIKMTDRLNDVAADLRGFASSRLQQWIAKGQIPRAPNRDALTADLVQSVFGEGELEVRLLKTNASRPQWTPVTRLEGSGGQRLTSAFLLFVTVGKVREYDTGISSAGFLLADNPLGKSNADDLMRIQTQMAKAYKIQLIYLTGISDENAQSMFDNHLFLNKVQKLRRRDLVTVDKERHALWAASLAAKPLFDPVI